MVSFAYAFVATGVALIAAPVVVTTASAIGVLWPFVPLALAVGAASHMRGDDY
jgi:hypothetical protein